MKWPWTVKSLSKRFIGDDGIDWCREAEIQSRRPYTKVGTSGILDYIREYFKEGESILDLGCNIGHWTYLFKSFNMKYEGLDASPKALSWVREAHPDILFHHMRAENMNFKDKYDVVFTNTVMQHIRRDNQRIVFRKILNALKPGGHYIMRELDSSESETHHIPEIWLKMLDGAGFEIVKYIPISKQNNTSTYILRKPHP